MPRTARLTRDDWAQAALDALAEGGPAAVAVEPVTARLGASKSSFYWLFPSRQALLEAALERWERVQTDEVLPWLAGIADPADRLRRLVRHAFAATGGGDLALSLLMHAGDPVVRPVVERVTRRRLATIEAAFAELGQPAPLAGQLAAACYAGYLGTAALRRVGAAPAESAGYLDTLLAGLTRP